MKLYVFTHNMPGYLPESGPDFFRTWDDAKAAALDYLEREGDFYFDAGQADLADQCSAEAEDLNLITQVSGAELPGVSMTYRASWSAQIGNVAYSIECDEIDVSDLSDEDCDFLNIDPQDIN